MNNGYYDLTLTVSTNNIRITGKCVVTSGVPSIDIAYAYYIFDEVGGNNNNPRNRKITMTLGASIEDRKGNLGGKLNSAFYTSPGFSTNVYYLKTVTNFTGGKKSAANVYDYSTGGSAYPCCILRMNNVSKGETIEFDFIISDMFLYEGGYIKN